VTHRNAAPVTMGSNAIAYAASLLAAQRPTGRRRRPAPVHECEGSVEFDVDREPRTGSDARKNPLSARGAPGDRSGPAHLGMHWVAGLTLVNREAERLEPVGSATGADHRARNTGTSIQRFAMRSPGSEKALITIVEMGARLPSIRSPKKEGRRALVEQSAGRRPCFQGDRGSGRASALQRTDLDLGGRRRLAGIAVTTPDPTKAEPQRYARTSRSGSEGL